jgi:glycosyltransferase involved in cell wall biosynthesis
MLTYNRRALFERTLDSLRTAGYPFHLLIVDNGSNDGTQENKCITHHNTSGDHAVGLGMNLAINAAIETEPDLIIFTADDYEYKPFWLHRLVNFWEARPANTVLASLNIEPDYNWNTVYSDGIAGGERYVMRESLPGSNWVFTPAQAQTFLPLPHITGGEDLAVCARLRGLGQNLAALDLSEHIGERESAWNNQSWTIARPFNFEKYGMRR